MGLLLRLRIQSLRNGQLSERHLPPHHHLNVRPLRGQYTAGLDPLCWTYVPSLLIGMKALFLRVERPFEPLWTLEPRLSAWSTLRP